LEEKESNQEEDSALPSEEPKDTEVSESHEQPAEELKVDTEHKSAPADVAVENKTQEVLKVVL